MAGHFLIYRWKYIKMEVFFNGVKFYETYFC